MIYINTDPQEQVDVYACEDEPRTVRAEALQEAFAKLAEQVVE